MERRRGLGGEEAWFRWRGQQLVCVSVVIGSSAPV